MERFVVRKNTLPYVHQWAVVDTRNWWGSYSGNKVGEYKTKKLAEKACKSFEKHGLPEDTKGTTPGFESAWNALNKRMEHPDGDPLPKPPERKTQHSNKRPVELD